MEMKRQQFKSGWDALATICGGWKGRTILLRSERFRKRGLGRRRKLDIVFLSSHFGQERGSQRGVWTRLKLLGQLLMDMSELSSLLSWKFRWNASERCHEFLRPRSGRDHCTYSHVLGADLVRKVYILYFCIASIYYEYLSCQEYWLAMRRLTGFIFFLLQINIPGT